MFVVLFNESFRILVFDSLKCQTLHTMSVHVSVKILNTTKTVNTKAPHTLQLPICVKRECFSLLQDNSLCADNKKHNFKYSKVSTTSRPTLPLQKKLGTCWRNSLPKCTSNAQGRKKTKGFIYQNAQDFESKHYDSFNSGV